MNLSDQSRWAKDPMGAFLKWKSTQLVNGRKLADHTIQQYAAMFGVYLEWVSARQTDFLSIQPDGIEAFLNALTPRRPRRTQANSEVAPSTRRRYLTLLHGIYEHLRLTKVREHNPCATLLDLAEHQALPRPAPTLLRPAAVKRYISWTHQQPLSSWLDMRDQALRLIFLASGISVAEARAIQVDDIVWDPSESTPIGIEIAPHGFVKARVAPLRELGRTALVNWLKAREMLVAEHQMADVEIVFLARVNDPNRILPAPAPISAPELFNIIQEASVAAGHARSRQGAQTLRNTFAAQMLAEGHDEATVARWLGLTSTEQVFTIGRLVPYRQKTALASITAVNDAQ